MKPVIPKIPKLVVRAKDPGFAEFIRETAAKLARMIDDNSDRVPFPLDAISTSIKAYLQYERDHVVQIPRARVKSKKREIKRPAEPRLSLVR